MQVLALLALLWSTLSFASDIHELELRQWQLGQEYKQLILEIPTGIEIANESLEDTNAELVTAHVQKIKAFFKKYDDFNLDKIDFFQKLAVDRAEAVAAEHIRLHGKLTRRMQKHLTNLKESRLTYLERKRFFGLEEDTSRLQIGQKVLHHYGEFAKAIREHAGEKVERNFGRPKLLPFVDKPKEVIKSFDKLMLVLWSFMAQKNTGEQDRAPIIESFGKVQKELMEMRGIETKWDGLDNLEDLSHNGKTLNMFLMNHANSFLDSAAQQSFPVKGVSAMGNIEVFFGPILGRPMIKSDHIVAIGHGDIIAKTKNLVESKQLNKFWISAEGINGTGLYEMRPILPLFHSAIYEAINRGLDLKLYPIAYPDHFRLLNDWRNPIEGKIPAHGIVLKPFTNQHCLQILKSTKQIDSLAQLVRWAWFSTLKNSETETLAMPFPVEIVRRLDLMIWGQE